MMLSSEETSSTNICSEKVYIHITGSLKKREDLDSTKFKEHSEDSLCLTTSEVKPRARLILIMLVSTKNGLLSYSTTISQK